MKGSSAKSAWNIFVPLVRRAPAEEMTRIWWGHLFLGHWLGFIGLVLGPLLIFRMLPPIENFLLTLSSLRYVNIIVFVTASNMIIARLWRELFSNLLIRTYSESSLASPSRLWFCTYCLWTHPLIFLCLTEFWGALMIILMYLQNSLLSKVGCSYSSF